MSHPTRILIIEDDETLVQALTDLLRSTGYQASAALTGHAALEKLAHDLPDLVLLDLHLPDMNGIVVLEYLRNHSRVPVMILSADARDTRKVRALETGADDYITKPFHQDELLARIAALLRRVGRMPRPQTMLEVGRLRVDMTRQQATLNDAPLHLTPIEYAILCILMQNAGRVVSHDELLQGVWGPGYERDYSILRVNISRLRQKIEEDPRHPAYILTVSRKGYRMPLAAGHGAI